MDYVISPYVRLVARGSETAVYHSLFGNLVLLDEHALNLLNAFRDRRNAEDVIGAQPVRQRPTVRAAISAFEHRGFLSTSERDDHELLLRARETRARFAGQGSLLRMLQLVLCNTCNEHCTYCLADSIYSSQDRERVQHSRENLWMSPKIARAAVGEFTRLLASQGVSHMHVEFFGGEPLMNWDAIDAVLTSYGADVASEMRYTFSVTTNGLLLTPAMMDILARNDVTTTVSIDGPETIFSHAGTESKGLDRVRDRIRMLHSRGGLVTVNTVIGMRTLETFRGRDLLEQLADCGVNTVGLILDLSPQFYTSPSRCAAAAEALLSTWRLGIRSGMNVVGYWHQVFAQIMGWRPHFLQSGYKTCPATGCKLSVEPDGSLFSCKCCSIQLGHLDDLETAIASDDYLAYALRVVPLDSPCRGCDIEGFCSGHCMGAMETDGCPGPHDLAGLCDIYREITRNMIREVPSSQVEAMCIGNIEEGVGA